MRSTLDPAQFGDPISAITAEHIKPRLEGLTVDQVITQWLSPYCKDLLSNGEAQIR